MKRWHTVSVAEIEKQLNTSVLSGLSRADAEERLYRDEQRSKRYGLPMYCKKRKSVFAGIFAPFASITYILYLLIALFSFWGGDRSLGIWAIALLLCQGIALGIMNVIATRSKERADQYSSPTVNVQRSGEIRRTDSRNIATGDIISFSVGDIICCDARLIEDCELVVDEFIFDESDGKLIRRRVHKNSSRMYMSNTSVGITDAQNIILAGSVVQAGEGRAIAVATGNDCVLAEHLKNGEMTGDIPRPNGTSRLLSYTRTTCVFGSALLLLIVFVGMFTLRSVELSYVFLMAISGILCISASITDIFSKIIFAGAHSHYCCDAIIKNNKAFDTLTGVSNILLLDNAPITDGELHISSLFLTGRRLNASMIESKPDRAHRLCEYIYTYLKVIGQGNNTNIKPYKKGLETFIKSMGYDTEGADLRIKSLYYIEESDMALSNTSEYSVRIRLDLDSSVISRCSYISVGDVNAPIDKGLRERIVAYIDECESTGEKLIYVVSERINGDINSKGTNIVLEGIMAFEEHVSDSFMEACEQYRQMGIRLTSLMSDEAPETLKYLINAGIISSVTDKRIAFASEFRQSGRAITSDLGKYSAYLGFEMSEYVTLATSLRKQGIVASIGVDDRYSTIMAICDTSATFNTLTYDTETHCESYYDNTDDLGLSTSANATQRGRIASSVLVSRKGRGGLDGLLGAIDASSAAYINLAYFIRFAACLTVMISALVILSAFSGILLINPLQISALYMFFSVVGTYFFAHNIPRREMLRRSDRGYIAYPGALIASSLHKFIGRVCAAVIFFVAALILLMLGIVGRQGIAFSAFCGVYAISVFDMLHCGATYSEKNNKKAKIITAIIVFSILILLAVALLVGAHLLDIVSVGEYDWISKSIQAVLGDFYGGKLDAFAFMLILVFVLSCIVSDTVFAKYSRKINQKIKSK